MSRKYTEYTNATATRLLDALVDQGTTPPDYQRAMTGLGREMAKSILAREPETKRKTVCVVCTVEDADYLARGVFDGLIDGGVRQEQLRLVCFWNERVKRFEGDRENSFDVAPIIREYREKLNVMETVLVVVKSIVSGACVVKTNIASLIETQLPERVIVAAPVMLEGAPDKLAREFPEEAARRFEYLTFAIDDQRDSEENVVPGIGGSVYERLGFEDKNGYTPDIVKRRRAAVA